jgi:hypothetical protein
MKTYLKEYGCKAAGATTPATAAQLAKINSFALRELTADEVYVRKFLICHSAIDRDNERFPEALLQQFAATFPGKSFIAVHNRQSLPLGLFFEATTETIPAARFKELTGEDPRLPEGETTVTVVWAWAYMLIKHREEIIDNLEAGVYRHVSIGFSAADCRPVRKEVNGPALYYEYVSPGETRECSLVYLGAQPGATTQKHPNDTEKHHKEEPPMKTIIALLIGCGMKHLTDSATEDQIAAGIKTLLDEKDAKITALETEKTALKASADLGQQYRDKTIDNYVALKHKLGEIGDEETAHAALKTTAAGLPFAFIENEVKSLEKRVAEKFPTTAQLDGDERRDKSDTGDNPLVPKDPK